MVKKFLIIMALGVSLFAGDKTDDKTARQEAMRGMEAAMAVIQKGFLTKNGALIKEGATTLSTLVTHVSPPKNDESLKESYDTSLTQEKADGIYADARRLMDSFEAGDTYKALEHHTSITKKCISCHAKIRKW